MKVLVILEDPSLDEHIAVPVVKKLFESLERRADVRPLREPHLRGVDQALDPEQLRGIVQGNPMTDLFLLLVDRDCNRFHTESRAMQRETEHPGKLIAAVAVNELETWMLALHKEALGTGWSIVRDHCDPKEAYAEPLLERQGWSTEVGKGRKRAMRDLSGQWRSLLTLCPEIEELRQRIKQRLAQ